MEKLKKNAAMPIESIELTTIRTIKKDFKSTVNREPLYVQEALEFKPITRTIRVMISEKVTELFEVNFDYIQFYKMNGITAITTTKQPAKNYDQLLVPALPNIKVDGSICLGYASNNLIDEINHFWNSTFVAIDHHWPTFYCVNKSPKPNNFRLNQKELISKSLNSALKLRPSLYETVSYYRTIYNV